MKMCNNEREESKGSKNCGKWRRVWSWAADNKIVWKQDPRSLGQLYRRSRSQTVWKVNQIKPGKYWVKLPPFSMNRVALLRIVCPGLFSSSYVFSTPALRELFHKQIQIVMSVWWSVTDRYLRSQFVWQSDPRSAPFRLLFTIYKRLQTPPAEL